MALSNAYELLHKSKKQGELKVGGKDTGVGCFSMCGKGLFLSNCQRSLQETMAKKVSCRRRTVKA